MMVEVSSIKQAMRNCKNHWTESCQLKRAILETHSCTVYVKSPEPNKHLTCSSTLQDGGRSKTNTWSTDLGKKSRWNSSRDFLRFCHIPVETCPLYRCSSFERMHATVSLPCKVHYCYCRGSTTPASHGVPCTSSTLG